MTETNFLVDGQLSKSAYLEGRQCLKRLWLSRHAPELAVADRGRATLAETSIAVTRHARALFPGGVLVGDADHDAGARTRALVGDPAVPAIFDAAFEHDGVRVRIDVLARRADGTWTLAEVKAGTHLRDVHLDDAAIQLYVASGAGVDVAAVELLHVNAEYVRGATLDWAEFFVRTDVTTEA